MQNPRISVGRRIEACEGLLEYETPQQIVEVAKEFLVAVFESEEVHVRDRLAATKLMRKFESPKVRQPVVVRQYPADYTETQRKIAIWDRQSELRRAGLQSSEFPPDWCSDIQSPDWIPPPPDPDAPKTIADIVRWGQERDRKAKLKVVKGDRDNPSQT
jgi:hypothetical protein